MAIRQYAQYRKQLRAALHLVQHDEALQFLKRKHRIREQSEIGKAIDRESLARLASRSWLRTIFCITQLPLLTKTAAGQRPTITSVPDSTSST